MARRAGQPRRGGVVAPGRHPCYGTTPNGGHGLPSDRAGRDDARTITLLGRGQALYVQSEEFCTSSIALVTRIRDPLTRSHRMVQNFASRKSDAVGALVRQKIRTGRLPRHSVAIVAGGPGWERDLCRVRRSTQNDAARYDPAG
jgi:hypothetical protein